MFQPVLMSAEEINLAARVLCQTENGASIARGIHDLIVVSQHHTTKINDAQKKAAISLILAGFTLWPGTVIENLS